ncbi:hypothetical protein [Aliarcobacter butzleri]|uniref:hypothetical protein n=1 Tax=Aliarcobacter butzleri TaxID=28197 RepID=UPI003B20FF89
MDKIFKEEYNLQQIMQMYWLRPEVITWTSMASFLIGKELKNENNIVELGIGNGYFTFISLGGRFKFPYDWYYNVDLKESSGDIYNTFYEHNNIESFIEHKPKTRINLAIDHKESLLLQASHLGFIDKTILADGNKPFDLPKNTEVFYSNILYWLKDPFEIIKRIDMSLDKVKLVLVFPNNRYKLNTQSHQLKNNLQILLNSGRETNMLWTMDLEEFEKNLSKYTSFKIKKSQTYVSELNSSFYDVGLRPLSKPLIKMVNKLSLEDRNEVKEEWIKTLEPYLTELLLEEINNGPVNGGFNFVVLEKNNA